MSRVAGRFAAVTLPAMLAGTASAQVMPHPAPGTFTGRYDQPGCVLEVARVAADSLHLQLRCRRPAPTYNLGFLDELLPLVGRDVTVERREASGSCRIRFHFSAVRAIVTQEGTDYACGFGGGIDVSGSYRRIWKRRPAFDLDPRG